MKKSNFDIENGEKKQNQMEKKPLFNTKKEKPPSNNEYSEEKTLKESQTILYNPKKQLHKKALPSGRRVISSLNFTRLKEVFRVEWA